ncbi:MAG: hypothetical protein ACE5F1_16280 [Planctomycetota bacterium]
MGTPTVVRCVTTWTTEYIATVTPIASGGWVAEVTMADPCYGPDEGYEVAVLARALTRTAREAERLARRMLRRALEEYEEEDA